MGMHGEHVFNANFFTVHHLHSFFFSVFKLPKFMNVTDMATVCLCECLFSMKIILSMGFSS